MTLLHEIRTFPALSEGFWKWRHYTYTRGTSRLPTSSTAPIPRADTHPHTSKSGGFVPKVEDSSHRFYPILPQFIEFCPHGRLGDTLRSDFEVCLRSVKVCGPSLAARQCFLFTNFLYVFEKHTTFLSTELKTQWKRGIGEAVKTLYRKRDENAV